MDLLFQESVLQSLTIIVHNVRRDAMSGKKIPFGFGPEKERFDDAMLPPPWKTHLPSYTEDFGGKPLDSEDFVPDRDLPALKRG